jgi:hypothetical protein
LPLIRLCRRGKADSNNEECGNDVLPEDEPSKVETLKCDKINLTYHKLPCSAIRKGLKDGGSARPSFPPKRQGENDEN